MTTHTPDAVREDIRAGLIEFADLIDKHGFVQALSGHAEMLRQAAAALDSRAGEDVRPNSWAATPDEVRERAQLLADVELHLKSSRIFITTREKMHPCGVELHDELLGRVTAAIDSIGKAKGHD